MAFMFVNLKKKRINCISLIFSVRSYISVLLSLIKNNILRTKCLLYYKPVDLQLIKNSCRAYGPMCLFKFHSKCHVNVHETMTVSSAHHYYLCIDQLFNSYAAY